MIRVLQATAWYPPHHLGGTEVYLTGLVRGLRNHSVTSRILAPLAPQAEDRYEHDGAVVRTYPVNQEASRSEFRGRSPHEGFSRFCEILREEQPDVYHQHSWTRGLGAQHLEAAHKLGLKTVLTLHTPNAICLRGTMMHFGEEACDGRIRISRCSACWGHARGAPKPISRLLARVPRAVGNILESVGVNARFSTALSARGIAAERRSEFAHLLNNADRIVAVCQWLYDALACNGVPVEKLVLSRQGVDESFESFAVDSRAEGISRSNKPFRLIYVGRWHPVKGLDVLVKSVLAIPRHVPLELVIHGLGSGPEEREYEAAIRKLAMPDSRIRIVPPVSRQRLAGTLQEADALAVPSVWLETGPLVVLEAKAIGLPVIGSRIGGIAELVQEPEDGVLVAPNAVDLWTQAILEFSGNYRTREREQRPRAIRTMRDAAQEMATLYRSLC